MPVTDKRLIVCTPAGRRRYLEVLAPYVLGEPAVDEWHLWANTDDVDDLAWMDARAAVEPRARVRVVRGHWRLRGNLSIHRYFRACTDPSTVYVRLDDDIVYAAPGAIPRLAERRLEDPEPFLWFGNIFNNAIISYLHQRAGRLPTSHGWTTYQCMDEVGWNSGPFAVTAHRRFLADPGTWSMPDWDLRQYERYSINAFAWTGEDFATFGGRVGKDEEQWLSVDRPRKVGRPCRVAGDCVFSHYAFSTQRPLLDRTPDVLTGYRALAGLA